MSNRAMGSDGEKKLAQMLAEKGFWVHLLQQNKAGQPCDIIAVDRDGRGHLIDSKVCANSKFDLARIEPNQELVAQKWNSITGLELWFALWIGDEIFMWSFSALMEQKAVRSVLPAHIIRNVGIPFKDWVAWMSE